MILDLDIFLDLRGDANRPMATQLTGVRSISVSPKACHAIVLRLR